MNYSPMTLTVSQLNEYIKAIFDSTPNFYDIYIKGEISNFTNHYRTGHFYFSLKDDSSVLKCVMFRAAASSLTFMPENGMKVIVRGRISVFQRDGVYQLYAEEITPDGIGSLYLAFEQLKQKLETKGLFSEMYKKPIPRFPQRIGIITAETGAAVADMKNIITRRYPITEIYIYPSLVQGAQAPANLIKGLRYFNEKFPVDTIIIGRGGGSIEDLWAFNNEELAYAVFESQIPVISAVGHETDFTICDFVADLRAPTPSAAAELAVPDRNELLSEITGFEAIIQTLMQNIISEYKSAINHVSNTGMFKDPMAYIHRMTDRLSYFSDQISRRMCDSISKQKNKLSESSAKLSVLSPLSVLSRGYSLVKAENGSLLSDIGSVSIGDNINITLKNGNISATVTNKEKSNAGKKTK